jgi:hypothetical protein
MLEKFFLATSVGSDLYSEEIRFRSWQDVIIPTEIIVSALSLAKHP